MLEENWGKMGGNGENKGKGANCWWMASEFKSIDSYEKKDRSLAILSCSFPHSGAHISWTEYSRILMAIPHSHALFSEMT